jgi:streptogramin lyase
MTRLALTLGVLLAIAANCEAEGVGPAPRSINELKPVMTRHLGATADWVEVTADAVWVGSTGPNAVNRIDPRNNKVIAKIPLPGEPCARLAAGFGSLWIPLCGASPSLARVNLSTNRLQAVYPVGPAAAEGGITTSGDSVWMVTDKSGLLARIDPHTGNVRQQIHIAAGSYNPLFYDGKVWVSRADGTQVTVVDADDGGILATTSTGPGPRFLAAGNGAVWSLNQGDGTLTRLDAHTWAADRSVELNTPGHGGDIAFDQGLIWTTVSKMPLSVTDAKSARVLGQWQGPGGDSLGLGHGSVWLTDYHGGTISRFDTQAILASLPQ